MIIKAKKYIRFTVIVYGCVKVRYFWQNHIKFSICAAATDAGVICKL
jgi:hypothetical protein